LKHLLRKQGGEGALLSTGLNRITTLTTIRFSARRQNSSLLRMLTRTCKWLATDPRDKCLTLAGLADEESQQLLHDRAYIQSVKECYAYVSEITASSEKIGPLNFLDFAVNCDQTDLPSWVPDWSYSGPLHGSDNFLYHQVGSTPAAVLA
jgi:hypothetical protein